VTPRDSGAGLVGKLLSGRYRIEAFVAQSSGGALYRGEHVHMRKRIAVKVLGAAAAAAPEALARFEREAIAGAHVDHPNVAAAKDFGALDDGARFLVVEYLDGQTLRQLLDQVHSLPPERALRVARQLALGLSAAHQRGIVHRALAPDNVWLVSRGGEDDVVKIVDFGSAMLPPELVSARPAPGRADRLATPVAAAPSVLPYSSPEVVLGGSIDGRSDLYSLGVMLHEMFGVAPAQLRGGAPPVVAMPAGLAELARRLVAPDPAQRPESAEEVGDTLERIESATRRASLVSPGELATGETVLSQPSPLLRTSGAAVRVAPAPEPARATAAGPTPAPGDGRAAAAAAPMPRAISLAVAGLGAIVLLVVGAIVLRAPLGDEGEAVAAPGAHTSAPTSGAGTAKPSSKPAAAAAGTTHIEPAIDPESGARVLSEQLVREVDTRRWKDGVVTLERLVAESPEAVRVRDTRNAVVELAMRVMLVEGDASDRVFALLTGKLEELGIDILYELMTTKGGSRAAKRASDLLAREDIRKRGSDALRIAYELRQASCAKKPALFERAQEDGDTRTLGLLVQLNRSCRRRDTCCMNNDPRLKQALEALRTRLEK
jgi:serine/threonine-protein kinase